MIRKVMRYKYNDQSLVCGCSAEVRAALRESLFLVFPDKKNLVSTIRDISFAL